MTISLNLKPVGIIAAQALVIFSCSTTPDQKEDYQSSAAEETLQNLEQVNSDKERLEMNNANILANEEYSEASEAIEDANEVKENFGSLSEIREDVATAKEQLTLAERRADLRRPVLADVLKARDDAINADATKYETFAEIDQDFVDSANSLNFDDMAEVEETKMELIGQYKDLELRAIKDRYLSDVRKTIKDSRDEKDAEKYVPTALKNVEKSLSDLEKYIDQNRYADKQINERLENLSYKVRRMSHLLDYAKWVDDSNPETVAVWVEDRLEKIETPIDLTYLQDRPFEEQVDRVANSIESLKLSESQLAELRMEDFEKTMTLEATKRELATQEDWESKLRQVGANFSPKEAEILRQENKIIVRLKALDFDIGASQIKSKDFDLLNRVGKSVALYGQSAKVQLVGHTDSTGGFRFNKMLSEDRATAVKRFLVSNGYARDQNVKIETAAFSQPLSENKTAAGRALNRRVDVVITP